MVEHCAIDAPSDMDIDRRDEELEADFSFQLGETRFQWGDFSQLWRRRAAKNAK